MKNLISNIEYVRPNSTDAVITFTHYPLYTKIPNIQFIPLVVPIRVANRKCQCPDKCPSGTCLIFPFARVIRDIIKK